MCVNDLLDGLERTNGKLPEIGSGRAISNADMLAAAPEVEQQPVAWLPYLTDRADGDW